MKLSPLNSVIKVDSSSSRSGEITRELQSIKTKLVNIEHHNKNSSTTANDSPYVEDRPDYNPNKIKGTQRELEWKKVPISREQQLKETNDESITEAVTNHSLSKRLNIL